MGGSMSTILQAGNATSGAVVSSDTAGSLQIQTGSTPTTAINIDTGGRITNPLQTCFYAYSGAAISSPNTWTTWTSSVNVSSAFNATTGVFTAPVAGTYMFTVNAISNGVAASLEIFIQKNGATLSGSCLRVGGAGNAQGAASTVIVTLAINDTISLYINSGTTNTNSNFNGFSGRLIQ